MGQCGPPVGNQFPREEAIDLVEMDRRVRVFVRFTHGRTVSEGCGAEVPADPYQLYEKAASS
jgi:hypothetical protein